MRSFILKINGNTRCPDGISRPASVYDWASGTFFCKRISSAASKYADGKAGPEPLVGDRVYIWVNEKGKDSHGLGLTARASIDTITAENERYRLQLSGLTLMKKEVSMDEAFTSKPSSNLLREMKRYRLERIWALDEEDLTAIDALIDEYGGFQQPTDEDPIAEALLQQADNIARAVLERKSALIKPRPRQAAFRQVAIERHGGRCVFTKTRVIETLEAAHVIPHTGAQQFERPENSLLLRRDVHALFDLFLLSIDPDTSRIRVSPQLVHSFYAELEGRVVEHQLSGAALNFHFQEFLKATRL
ncbi:hypothetical protein PSM7751_00760 [Pseudooceanicola marinus]|uniref:HNH nuclease domain-containing protein n=1 Tax=Pseudooceanicola marinus TaxID=396013 RepID=A0A1X6YK10_9RHOB|nr:HNH endonuclease signature motif containing protein [Pseudooceanicola marinus]SLN23602.1 hypothetical protein PSM7751_00760 [Pseudooceanicola marinus]